MRDRVLQWLKAEVPPSRIRHILGVEEMAGQLADIHGVDRSKAAQAGLLHDLAKYFKSKKLLKIAVGEGWVVDEICLAHPHLLHADVSAVIARREFGVEDADILAAIANHTLGTPSMDTLSCIVFVADTLEPNRGNTPELEHLRQISHQNLYQAVWLSCDYALKYLLDTRNPIHPRTIATRNWALELSASDLPRLLTTKPSS
jgi:predicted HD superfamily hydrolase involved in NAD metabolism